MFNVPKWILRLFARVSRFETFALLLWLVNWYLEIQDWAPDFLFVITSCTLSAFYAISGVAYLRSEGAHPILKMYDMLIGIAASILMLGVLYRTKLWPMRGFILNLGMILMIAQIVFMSFPRIQKHLQPDIFRIIIRIAILGGIGGFYWLVFLI